MSTSPEAQPPDLPQAEKPKISNARIWGLVGVGLMGVAVISFGVVFLSFIERQEDQEREEINRSLAVEAEMNLISAVLTMYKRRQGQLPSTEEGLNVLVESPPTARNQKALIDSVTLEDPWGHPFQYRQIETEKGPGFDLWSLGPDGQDGTQDDFIHRKPSAK